MGTEWQDETPYPGPSFEPSLADLIEAFGKAGTAAIDSIVAAFVASFTSMNSGRRNGKTAAIEAMEEQMKAYMKGYEPILAIMDEINTAEKKRIGPTHVGPRPRKQFDHRGRRRY